MSTSDSPVVVFDLGGVLVRINRTWQAAASAAGIRVGIPNEPPAYIWHVPVFEQYEARAISDDDYLAGVAEWLSITPADALLVHNAILGEPYDGIDTLVAELAHRGIATGCLSNTNDPHWAELTCAPRYALVQALPLRMASCEVAVRKPEPEIYAAFERKFGVDSARIVYFDDHVPNLAPALDRGWRAHHIDPSGDTAAQIRAILGQESVL